MRYNFGAFTIDYINGKYSVWGNREVANRAFRSIHRQPPNEYGNFYGREKAGALACRELIAKYAKDVIVSPL